MQINATNLAIVAIAALVAGLVVNKLKIDQMFKAA